MQEWTAVGFAGGSHVVANLSDGSSWALPYNFFADKWLGTGLVSDAVSVRAAYHMDVNV